MSVGVCIAIVLKINLRRSLNMDYGMLNRFQSKRVIAIVLAFLLFVTAFSGMQFINVSASEAEVIMAEDFDDNPTGTFPDGWIDENGVPEEDQIDNVVVEFPSSTDKSLQVAKPAVSGANRVTKEFEPVTENVTISFDLNIAEQYTYFQFNLYDGSNRPVRLVVRNEGAAPSKQMLVFDGGFSNITGIPYEPDQWYRIKYVIDPTKQAYDFFVNGKLIASNQDFFGSSFDAFTKIDFHSASGAATTEVYIDNVKMNMGGEVLGEHYGHEKGEVILGEPTGGGDGYTEQIDPADAQYVVDTKDELLDALSEASEGDIVYVEDDAEIDLTSMGTTPVHIPGGVTLASGRGKNGSLGGLIYTDFMKDMEPDTESGYVNRNKQLWIDGLLTTTGPNVRITGLRIQGNDMETGLDIPGFRTYMLPVSTGIYSDDWIEIDNNEIYGWSFAGVRTGNGYIHHNHIHHTWRTGLGYSITMDFMSNDGRGVLVEGNHLDKFRHAIAGMGLADDAYEASYNLVGTGISFAFDMHTNKEGDIEHGANGGTYIAGDVINIHHNTFTDLDNRAVTIRGVSVDGTYMDYNWFYRPVEEGYEVVQQRNSYGNFFVGTNAYGADQEIREGHVPPMTSSMSLNSLTMTDLLGNSIEELKPDQYVQVDASVKNNYYYPGQASLLTMIKDEDGAIQGMTHTSSDIRPRESSKLQAGLTLPSKVAALSVESYVWNSISEMRPANAYEDSEEVTAHVEINGNTLTISGSTTAGEGRFVTVLVLDSNHNPIYIDEIEAGTDGEYSIDYKVTNHGSDSFTVKVGGDGVETPLQLEASINN